MNFLNLLHCGSRDGPNLFDVLKIDGSSKCVCMFGCDLNMCWFLINLQLLNSVTVKFHRDPLKRTKIH